MQGFQFEDLSVGQSAETVHVVGAADIVDQVVDVRLFLQAGAGLGKVQHGQVDMLVLEGVYSMEGHIARLPELAEIAEEHNCFTVLDDAHGFGVLPSPALRYAGDDAPEIYVATLGKSLGASGAFVAGSEALIEYLIQRARTWVFSTAPPPAIAAAARAALQIVLAEPEHQTRLAGNIARFRAGIAALGRDLPFELMASTTPIQPLLVGDAGRAMALSRQLFERGYWVAAIRPPTVPAGTSRLRVTLSAAHTEAQIDGLVAAIAECRLPAAV